MDAVTIKTFDSVSLSPEKFDKLCKVKQKAEDLLAEMQTINEGQAGEHLRYLALSKTALEESVMWFNKGLSRK